jgi:hypothetical protein
MLPFANPKDHSTTIQAGGKTWVLKPMTDQAGMDWVKATIEDGRIMAAALGDTAISDETIRSLYMRGYERTAQALGCDILTAAEMTDQERRAVIAAQDVLNQTAVIEPFLTIEQAAARAFLGMPSSPG